MVFTSESQTLQLSVLDSSEKLFKVKSDRDAKLTLLSVPSNLRAPLYEITIGAQSNTKCVLKLRMGLNDVYIDFDTPDVLSATELRPFWLSWSNGTLRFGRGDVFYQNSLFIYNDPQPAYRKHIHAIELGSGTGSVAEWEVSGQNIGGNIA